MAKSRVWGTKAPEGSTIKFCMPGAMVHVHDVITHANYDKDRLRGFGVARGQILAFSDHLCHCHYNTLALPCEWVMALQHHGNLSQTITRTWILFLSEKKHGGSKITRRYTNCLKQCTVLWPAVIYKIIMQQNRIKLLHHNGNLLEQKRRCSNIPSCLHQSPA